MTLDVPVREEQGRPTGSPPRKKQKSNDTPRSGRASSIHDPSLSDTVPKKRKKKHKPRALSSGSAADLSSDYVQSSGPTEAPRELDKRRSSPPEVDPTVPSRAASPLHTPATPPVVKAKRSKAEVNSVKPAVIIPFSTSGGTPLQPPRKKRAAAPSEVTEESSAKKAKKKVKEPLTEIVTSETVPAPSTSTPGPITKGKKKANKGEETDTAPGHKVTESDVVPSPPVADTPAKGSKKKTVASPSTQLDSDKQNLGVQDQEQRKKKSKSHKADETATGGVFLTL